MIRYHFLAKGFCFGRSVSGASRFIRMGNHSHSEEVNGSEKLEFDFTGLKEHNLRRTTKKVVGKSVIQGNRMSCFLCGGKHSPTECWAKSHHESPC